MGETTPDIIRKALKKLIDSSELADQAANELKDAAGIWPVLEFKAAQESNDLLPADLNELQERLDNMKAGRHKTAREVQLGGEERARQQLCDEYPWRRLSRMYCKLAERLADIETWIADNSNVVDAKKKRRL